RSAFGRSTTSRGCGTLRFSACVRRCGSKRRGGGGAGARGGGGPPRSGGGARGGARLPLLEVTLTDGRKLTQDTGAVLGTIDNRMTREQLTAKCRDLMTPVLGAAACQRLIDRVLALDKVKDIREL